MSCVVVTVDDFLVIECVDSLDQVCSTDVLKSVMHCF